MGDERLDREQFVRMGVLTEVALLVAALIIDTFWPLSVEQNPLRTSTGLATWSAILCGLAGGVLLSGWFMFSWKSSFAPLRKIRDFVMEQLAPPLSRCNAWEIMVIAAFAGIGEEVLFRGVMQPRIGWFITSVIFGFAHAITPTYVIVAGILGGVLGQLQQVSGNLWTPILAHAVYDYIGFYLVIHEYRKSQPALPSGDA